MTNLVAGHHSVDLTTWAFEPGWQGTSHSATQFVIEQDGSTKIDTFTGHDFGGYDSHGFPTVGTITGIEFEEHGDLVVTLTNFSMTVAEERAFSSAQDMAGFQAALFSGDNSFGGSTQDDHYFGLGGNDAFDMSQGGDDIAEGDDGDDTFDFGNQFSANDTIDGGTGFDTLSLNGNYSAGVTFGASTIGNVEAIHLTAGHDYSLTLNDGNVGAGASLHVDGSALGLGDSLNLDGSAETDGLLNVVGGAGDDHLVGGASGDILSGGSDGTDTLYGGGGDDLLVSEGGHTTMSGGDGNDTFDINGGGEVFADAIAGGAITDTLSADIIIEDTDGIDTIDLRGALSGATINLNTGGTVAGRTVVIGGGGGTAKPLDLVFAQDLTGTFSDDLPNVVALMPDIISAVRDVQPDARFGVTSFKDKPISPFGGGGDYAYETDVGLTTHTKAIKNAYADFSAFGGNDTPEAQLEALQQLGLRKAEIGWNKGATHVVVFLTDDVFHVAGDGAAAGIDTANNGDKILDGSPPSTGEDYPEIDQVRDALLSNDVIPVFAVTSNVLAFYQDLVDQLGFGTVVELESDSSNIVQAVSDAVDFVSNSTVIENVEGTDFADTITGNDAANEISGNRGDDTLYGGGGKDALRGGNGRDSLYGGAGNDFLTGGVGKDTLEGGAGADTYRFGIRPSTEGHSNTIVGFDPTEDKIGLQMHVKAVDEAVSGHGSITDLADHAHLGKHHALIVTQESDGHGADRVFLVVDINGTAGFQADDDLLVRLDHGVHLDNLDTGDFV